MLRDNARTSGMEDLFDELLSTETNQTYKPDAAAYALGMSHLGLKKEEIVFAAFGGWDYYGAKTFGYPTYWVNRFHLPAEELAIPPDATSDTLEGLLQFVLPGGAGFQPAMPRFLGAFFRPKPLPPSYSAESPRPRRSPSDTARTAR
jgi:2-haloacid dehalogenase